MRASARARWGKWPNTTDAGWGASSDAATDSRIKRHQTFRARLYPGYRSAPRRGQAGHRVKGIICVSSCLMLRLLAFAAAASAFADGLKVGSTTNYTLGGWISASASGTASLNASRIGIRSLPPITCGFLVGHRPSAPYGDSWAKLQDGSSYASRVQSVRVERSSLRPTPMILHH